MSFQSLYIGVSGLTAAQRAIEVAGHNISNANTTGYSRQRVNQVTAPPMPGVYGSRGTGMRGSGVTIAEVIRIRNEFVDSAYRAEKANGSAWSARSEVLTRAEQVLGTFDSGTPSALAEFWAAWDQLSLYPEDPAARQGVIDRGALLTDSINSAANQITALERDTDVRIREDVLVVNQLTDEISRLNRTIKDATIGAQEPNDLLDRRDHLIDQLADLTGATVRESEFNQVDVYLGSTALVRGEDVEAIEASVIDPPTISLARGGAPVTPAGALGARLELVHETLPSLATDLDDLANGLRDLINTQHQAGYDVSGAAGLAFFSGTGAAGLAVNPALTRDLVAASASGAAADGNNAIAVAGLRDSAAVSGNSVLEAVSAFGSRLGTLALEANTAAASSDTVLISLDQERASTNSVSIDEELADMIRYQRSFEAAARVITTVDQMLDQLINRTGLAGR